MRMFSRPEQRGAREREREEATSPKDNSIHQVFVSVHGALWGKGRRGGGGRGRGEGVDEDEEGGGYADDLFRSEALPPQLTLTVTA